MLFRRLFLIISIFVFASCDKKEIPLEGYRVSIINSKGTLLVDPVLSDKDVSLSSPSELRLYSQYGGNATNNLGNIYANLPIKKMWERDFSKIDSRAKTHSIVANGIVYFLEGKGSLLGYQLSTGKLVVRKKINSAKEYFVGLATDGARLFISFGSGKVSALSLKTMQELWNFNLGVQVRVFPAYASGRLYLMGTDNKLTVLNANNGVKFWDWEGVAEKTVVYGGGSAIIGRGAVYLPTASGEIVSLREENGYELWNRYYAENSVKVDVTSAQIVARPVLASGILYASSLSGPISAFDISNNEVIWEKPTGIIHSPVISGNVAYVMSVDNSLMAIAIDTGRIVWRSNFNKNKWWAPILVGNSLYVANDNGKMIEMSALDGKVIKLHEIEKNLFDTPIVVDGKMIFLSKNGKLVVYN